MLERIDTDMKRERSFTRNGMSVYFLTYPLPYPFVRDVDLREVVKEQLSDWRIVASQNKARMLRVSEEIDKLRESLGTEVRGWDSADIVREFREERCTF